jgi:hypothetical protein
VRQFSLWCGSLSLELLLRHVHVAVPVCVVQLAVTTDIPVSLFVHTVPKQYDVQNFQYWGRNIMRYKTRGSHHVQVFFLPFRAL